MRPDPGSERRNPEKPDCKSHITSTGSGGELGFRTPSKQVYLAAQAQEQSLLFSQNDNQATAVDLTMILPL